MISIKTILGDRILMDQDLQLALAKMLPDKLRRVKTGWKRDPGELDFHVRWHLENIGDESCKPVMDTEWLHVCWLVEQSFGIVDFMNYGVELNRLIQSGAGNDGLACHPSVFHVSWQQRSKAMCKVKGIAI